MSRSDSWLSMCSRPFGHRGPNDQHATPNLVPLKSSSNRIMAMQASPKTWWPGPDSRRRQGRLSNPIGMSAAKQPWHVRAWSRILPSDPIASAPAGAKQHRWVGRSRRGFLQCNGPRQAEECVHVTAVVPYRGHEMRRQKQLQTSPHGQGEASLTGISPGQHCLSIGALQQHTRATKHGLLTTGHYKWDKKNWWIGQ